MSESGQQSETGRPGRYQRTTGGLLAAMLVLLLAVAAFVIFRGIFRDTPRIEPEPVEYLPLVESLQDAGREVVYPRELPEGWMVTTVVAEPGERPAWGLGILTDDGRFLGLRQQDEDLEDLLAEHVDEETTEEEPLEGVGSVARTWEAYADEGGDHAYAAEVRTDVGDETLLVYGSAPAEDLRTLIESLTLDER
ncbi:DUF4245 family protein [Nocardioides dongkuii]|uniref:DUF4245 family protein n=1 Tax=Nocardioides dongkuii TaxID=2760089 RepID=UPI001877CE9A|nr:DUF4245 family protein [Nocardioides dongkuii]